jgi:SpoIIAA-like
MKNRIRFISHKQKKVLLVDGTGCSAEQLEEFATLVPARVTAEPLGSVLLLADFTGAHFDKKSVERFKPALVIDRPHLKRSAWVGMEGLPKIFYEHMKTFSQRELPTFKTREEALDWLVKDV